MTKTKGSIILIILLLVATASTIYLFSTFKDKLKENFKDEKLDNTTSISPTQQDSSDGKGQTLTPTKNLQEKTNLIQDQNSNNNTTTKPQSTPSSAANNSPTTTLNPTNSYTPTPTSKGKGNNNGGGPIYSGG